MCRSSTPHVHVIVRVCITVRVEPDVTLYVGYLQRNVRSVIMLPLVPPQSPTFLVINVSVSHLNIIMRII